MSNSLDPDLARHFVGPDLDPNCLQRLSETTLAGKELRNKITENLISIFEILMGTTGSYQLLQYAGVLFWLQLN